MKGHIASTTDFRSISLCGPVWRCSTKDWIDRKCWMKKIKANGLEAYASSTVPKRCASAIKRNEFCPECMHFFQALSGKKALSTTAEKPGRLLVQTSPHVEFDRRQGAQLIPVKL
jgi:hypothetical protein